MITTGSQQLAIEIMSLSVSMPKNNVCMLAFIPPQMSQLLMLQRYENKKISLMELCVFFMGNFFNVSILVST